MKAKSVIVAIMMVTCSGGFMSCTRNSPDCEERYKRDIDACERHEERSKAKIQQIRDRCDTMQDPVLRERCMGEADEEKDQEEWSKKRCEEKAKKRRDRCMKKR